MKEVEIIAVDFDGTVVKHEYPLVGEDVPGAVRVLKRLNEAGVKIIVWTMRCGDYLNVDAKEWFESRGIEVWAYNTNPQQATWTQSPKCYAQLYIDDAALGCPLITPPDARPYANWGAIEQLLEGRGVLPRKLKILGDEDFLARRYGRIVKSKKDWICQRCDTLIIKGGQIEHSYSADRTETIELCVMCVGYLGNSK